MRNAIGLAILVAALGGCATLPAREPTPFVPPGVFGTYLDNDTGAINLAVWAFASPANTRNNPAEAARAIVALEYLPGELSENPRWIGVDAAVKLHLWRARDDLRRILGIRPDAPSQFVVNAMLALMVDLQTGDQQAVQQTLASPAFTFPPQQTLQILASLPYVQEANLATARASDHTFRSSATLW